MSKIKLDSKSEQNILNMLLDNAAITSAQLSKVNSTSNEIGKTKLETAFELNITSENNIVKLLSSSYSLDIVELSEKKIDEKLKKVMDIRFIEENSIVPFEILGNTLKIAIPDGSKLSLMKNLKTMTKMEPELYAATITNVNNFIDRFKKLSNKKISEHSVKVEKVQRDSDEIIEVGAEVIVFVNKIITEAINLGSSDIHIECFRSTAQARFRVDGILKIMSGYSKYLYDNYNAVVNRFKMISKLDIAERRKPQDGASTFKATGKEVDLRVSVLPTKNAERIVLRILNKDAGEKKLNELGFESKDLEKLIKSITNPQGMVLVTGPTGSGKTTTLYSILKHINKPGMNILTAEDPVEYEMEGIGQVQIREDIEFTFASALRSFLRQDPEVILVGEMRDQITVDIALKAALTGHLVFSTLHTNDAPSSITRLQNMGTPNYLIASALTLIMAQRLSRKTCTECRVIDETVNTQLLNSIGFLPEQSSRAKIYKGSGCDHCNNTGYKGRMGIYEILEIDKSLKQAILSNLQQSELNALAKKNGFRTMQNMGHDLLLSGDLTFSEYSRVLQSN